MPGKLLWLGLGWLAAAGFFLSAINRILSYLRRRQLKLFLAASISAFLGIVFGWIGWGGGKQGHRLIVLALTALGAGETRYRLDARRLRGSPPVSRAGPARSLLRPVTTTDLNVYYYRVDLQPSPVERFGDVSSRRSLRIAQISDLHLNDHLPLSYYQNAVDAISASTPDLVFITGDFVTEIDGIVQFPLLARSLRGRLGAFGIFGNHDYWSDPQEVSRVVGDAGVTLLGNGTCRVQDGGLSLLIVGCEEPWSEDTMNLPEKRPGEIVLVLSHSADHAYRLSDYGADAVFSGHYHAGQFQIPGFGPLFVPSRFGRRFHHGHYVLGKTHLFVSAGIGASNPPLRLYCPPDVFIVDFYL